MSVTADKASAVGEWLERGRPVARAVLVAVEDSAPLAPGASLYVDADGTVEGSLTGGCVESAVAQEALAVLDGAPPGVHVYGISDELAGTAGLTCGGTVHVFVHALDDDDGDGDGDGDGAGGGRGRGGHDDDDGGGGAGGGRGRGGHDDSGGGGAGGGRGRGGHDDSGSERDGGSAGAVAAAAAAVGAGRPAALATVLDGPSAGATLALVPGETPAAIGSLRGLPSLDRAVLRDVAGLLDQGVTTIRSYGGAGEALGTELRVFVRSFAAPPQLLLFGANDFSAALAPLAAELGWAVTISDPRAAFAGAPRFARAAGVHVGWPDAALAGRRLGPRDAVLVFSHDPRLDLPALRGALATEAGYVGALGSRRTTAERNERLRAAGVDERQLARLHAPCGLDIGARTAEETALSVLAEIVAVRSGRSSLPLRETSGPIQPR